MIEQLFGSKTRVKLLKLFYGNPNRSFYVREITRTVDEQINSVRRELSNLLNLGIISADKSNNRLYYEVDQEYEYFSPLSEIFTGKVSAKSSKVKEKSNTKKSKSSTAAKDTKVKKSKISSTEKKDQKPIIEPKEHPEVSDNSAVELPESERWAKAGNFSGIAYGGVYTRDNNSPADIVLIGEANISKVENIIIGMEKDKKKELRYAVFSKKDWGYRRQIHDKFWSRFMSAKKQVVLDKDNLFSK